MAIFTIFVFVLFLAEKIVDKPPVATARAALFAFDCECVPVLDVSDIICTFTS